MAAQKKSSGGSRARKWIRRILALACAGALCAVGYSYVYPMAAGAEKLLYTSYTADTGDVSTTMSFNATISTINAETLQNSGEATVTKIYVTEDQQVSAGDKIIDLSNGQSLTAGIDGVVNEISVSEGDWLWRSRSLVQIADFSRLQVSLSVDEYDVQKVRKGQKCTVRMISLGLDLETEINHVNLVSSGMGNVASYSATAELDAPDTVLPGMAATVTIPAETVENVVTLPVAALAFHEDGAAYVLMKAADGSYTEQAVETGLSDGTTVEITSGVRAGDVVWAVSGTETVEGFSLAKMYASLVGESVVIESGERSRGNRGGTENAAADRTLPDGMERPDGMTPPTDGTASEGMPDFSQMGTPSDMGGFDGSFGGGSGGPPSGGFPGEAAQDATGGDGT